MNYQKIYDSLIAKRQQNPAVKTGPYTVAEHHILPKSMGGSNDKSNLVVLTNKEHFVAHHLLWKIYQNDEMTTAFKMMCAVKKYKVSAKIYAKLMEDFGKKQSNQMKGNQIWKGRHHSEESKRKISEKSKITSKGRKWSDKQKQKMSKLLKGRIFSEETKQKMRENHADVRGENNPNFGKHLSNDTKNKLSEYAKQRIGNKNPFYGKHHSEESLKKMRKPKSTTKNMAEAAKHRLGVYTNGIEYKIFKAHEQPIGWKLDRTKRVKDFYKNKL